MITVFVVVLANHYGDSDREVLGVAATMAEGKSIAEKRLRDFIQGECDWWESYTGQSAHLDLDMFRATVQAYDVVGLDQGGGE